MWLCLKVCCCTGLAVSGNRYLVQTWLCRANDACDVCIIRRQGCLQCLAEILTITDAVDDATAEAVDTIADLITCCVMSCMLAHQQAFKR